MSAAGDRTPAGADIPARPPRLVLRFALYTAAAFAVAAGATLWFAEREAVERAEKQVRFHAEFVADTILRDNLRASDFSAPVTGKRRERLDWLFSHEVMTQGVLRVKLYSPTGLVTYSSDHALIGTRSGEDAPAEAYAGETLHGVTNLNEEGGRGADKKVLEVYTPVRPGGGPIAGSFEYYQDYSPVSSSVRREVVPLAVILFTALVALFIALFPLLRRTTSALLSSIGEQQRSREALESAEEQLRQAQKMEAVGQLAGGVAHDFNNLLLAIRGYSELAQQDLNGGNDAVRADLERIQETVDHAGELTRRLLAFSRKQVLQPRVFDLNEAMTSVAPILRRLIGEHIAIGTETGAEDGYVRADPTQIEQVLINLAVNARDAMPEGGTLTIATSNADVVEPPPEAAPGRYTVVAVSDTGHGMDEETKSHLFEPFFTTKEEGRGTGLGLATVYGIVTQSDGFVEVESELGRGASFRVYLPTVEAPVEAQREDRDGEVRGGTETILVVEDDDAVRELLVRVLEGSGYRVLPAADARGAARVARAHDGPIHLLLVDVVLPWMNGPELAARVRAACPETRVLYVSGYAAETFTAEEVPVSDPLLRKPFSNEELARTVRETLDGHSQPWISSPVEISAARRPSTFDVPM